MLFRARALRPLSKAAEVRAGTSQTSGYNEVSFGSTRLRGRDAWKWVFDLGGTRRVDYFVNDCSTGIAVLGAASPSDFKSLAPTYERVASSVAITCSNSSSSSSDSSGQPPTTSEADFCSTHQCIPNFPNGTGFIVQCNDGMWSHSGGRRGACSYHGGESATTYP
ncbi:MAG: hypothetical protein NVS2B6_18620 [Thermoleophilaceae bacterium]